MLPVLYLSETIFTLSQEINVIWSRKWTAISWLYAFTRYLAVADCIVHLLPDNGLEVCEISMSLDLLIPVDAHGYHRGAPNYAELFRVKHLYIAADVE